MEINSAGDFSVLFSGQFILRLMCKFTELDTSIDESIGTNQQIVGNALLGEEKIVSHSEKELDYCIDIQGEAYNVFADFSISCHFSYKSNAKQHARMEHKFSEFIESGNTILIASDTYCLDGEHVHFYDPEYTELDIPFESTENKRFNPV